MNSSFHPYQAQMLQNHTQHILENSHQPMEYVHTHAVSNPLNHRQMGQQVINLSREILSRSHPRLEDMHFETVDDVCGQSHGFTQSPGSTPRAPGGTINNVQTFNRDGLQFSVTTRINVSCEQVIYIPGHPGYSTRTQGGAHFHTTSSSSQPPETVYTTDGSNMRGSNRAVTPGSQTPPPQRQRNVPAMPMRRSSAVSRRYVPYSAPLSQRHMAGNANVDMQSSQTFHSHRHQPYRVSISEFSTQTEQPERKADQSCSPATVRRLPLDEFLARDVIAKAKASSLKEEVQRQCSLLLGERYKKTEGENETVKAILSKTSCCKPALAEAVYRLRGGDLDVGLKCTKLCSCEEKTESTTGSNESSPSSSHENPICAICHEDYACGNMLRTLPCGHRYHMECIDKWLFTKSSACPMCKRDCSDKESS